MIRTLFVGVAALLAASGPVDQWGPFQNRREVSSSGTRYAVVRKVGVSKMSFELRQRRGGVPIMVRAAQSSWAKPGKRVDISSDPMDRLVAEGAVNQLPLQVLVPDTFDGLLLFDQYARVGHGKTVRWIDGAGKVVASCTLDDLFGRTPAGATHTVSSIWWNAHVSIDEERKSAVVIACDDAVREVASLDGVITVPDRQQLLVWCEKGSADRRAAMIEVVSRWADGGQLAQPVLLGLLHREQEAAALRCRAAVALAQLGVLADDDAGVARAVLEAGIGRTQPDAVRRYALENLPAVFGDDAIAMLIEVLTTDKTSAGQHASFGMIRVGKPALPQLTKLLLDDKQPDYCRSGAAHIMGQIGDVEATEPLLRAVAIDIEGIANSALNALVAIKPAGLAERLVPLLLAGSGDDARIFLYYGRNPIAAAVPALERACERFEAGTTERKWADEALAACRKAADGK